MGRHPFYPDTKDFLEKSLKHQGNITAIAEEYGVTRETVYLYMKRNPEGKDIREKTLNFNTEIQLDLAEKVHMFNMENMMVNPGLAQRAAEKIIDKKGHTRGWGVPDEQGAPREQEIVDRHAFIEAQYRITQLEKELNEAKSKANSELQRSY